MKAASFALAVIYGLGGVWTFGHVWNRTECRPERAIVISCGEQKAAPSLMAMMFWPLALSVFLQETSQ